MLARGRLLYDIRPQWRRTALSVFATAILIFLVDRLCGLFVLTEYETHSLALPPSEAQRFEFRDFQFTVSINRLGFRGPEFPIRRTPGVKRIAVLGNSFTYGWGVDFEQTWPYRLEKGLTASGVPVEVANLSRPAATGLEMKDIAARAIPLLKPDLIIISVLQGGVLTTLQGGAAADPKRERAKNARGLLLNGLDHLVPNYVQVLQTVRQNTAATKFIPWSVFRRAQVKAAENRISQFKDHERQRFNALDPASVDRFITGTLNSGIIIMALDTPDFWIDTVKSAKMIEAGEKGMREAFAAIKALAEENGVDTVVTLMPYGAYLGGAAAENLRRVGFNIPAFLDNDRSTEDQIRRAAEDARVQFISVLDGFQASRSDDLFIPFDGHYSAAGTKIYADLLLKELTRELPLLARWNNTSAARQN
jgi:hypothetical protein